MRPDLKKHVAQRGSQRQIQQYVNNEPELLQRTIARHIPALQSQGISLTWVSPLRDMWFVEFRDRAFIEALGLGRHADALAQFWPQGGPCWDALGVGSANPDATGLVYLLVEAKSHPGECKSECKATSTRSILQIERSLDETAASLGAKRNLLWTTTYYQYVNRLAHLHFMRRHLGLNAWLVNAYFCGDPYRPTTEGQWRDFLRQVKTDLNLPQSSPHVVDLFCPAIESVAQPGFSGGTTSVLPDRRLPDNGAPPAVSILAGLDDIVDEGLGVGHIGTTKPHYKHKASCLKLRLPSVETIAGLLHQMYATAKRNWGGQVRGSGQNWRWNKVLKCVGKANEVDLAKWISAVTDYDWVNAIPTASGLVPEKEEKHRNIDLAHRIEEGIFELIELKVEHSSDTPLSAAVQLLQYFVLYALARTTIYGSGQEDQPLLAAREIHLKVLAPEGFYRGYDLSDLERVIDRALSSFHPDGLAVNTQFRFTRFPSGFAWPDASIEELKAAILSQTDVFLPGTHS